MLRHVSPLTFGHLQGTYTFYSTCRLCFNVCGKKRCETTWW